MSDYLVLVPDPLNAATINTGAFAGLTQATLLRMLGEAQLALHALKTGQQTAIVAYGEGSGQKSVTFRSTNVGTLTDHVRELRIALGLRGRRRPVTISF